MGYPRSETFKVETVSPIQRLDAITFFFLLFMGRKFIFLFLVFILLGPMVYTFIQSFFFLLFMGRKFILPFLEFIVLGPMGYSCTQSLYFFYRENDRNKNNEACASF